MKDGMTWEKMTTSCRATMNSKKAILLSHFLKLAESIPQISRLLSEPLIPVVMKINILLKKFTVIYSDGDTSHSRRQKDVF